MDHFQQIYQSKAEQYDQFISYEDYQGNIGQHLKMVYPLENTIIVELGAGTGRLTRLLAPYATALLACDVSLPMLKVAKTHLSRWS